MDPLQTKVIVVSSFGGPAPVATALRDHGWDVVSLDAGPESLRELAVSLEDGRGASRTSGDADLVIITWLASPELVEEVYMGGGGLVEIAPPGTFLVDMTPSTPQLARELHAIGAVGDLHVVDALLLASFGVHAPDSSVIAIGGDEHDCGVVEPLLATTGFECMRAGAAGTGQLARLMHSISFASTLMGLVESLTLAIHSGLDPALALKTLAVLDDVSESVLHLVAHTLEGDYEGMPNVGYFVVELGYALAAADELDLMLPGIEAAYQLYDLLSVIGGGDLGPQGLALLYADEQTCSDNGLDWSAADELDYGEAYDDGYEDPYAQQDGYRGFSTVDGYRGVQPQGRPHHGPGDPGDVLGSFFSPN